MPKGSNKRGLVKPLKASVSAFGGVSPTGRGLALQKPSCKGDVKYLHKGPAYGVKQEQPAKDDSRGSDEVEGDLRDELARKADGKIDH